MSWIEDLKKAIVGLPVNEIMRERIGLVIEQLADAERKNDALNAENGGLKAQLQREQGDHQKTKAELESLREKWAEEKRISCAIEFRRGKRTGNVWMAFCPKCGLPASEYPDHTGVECSGGCGWLSVTNKPVLWLIRDLENQQKQ